MNDIIRRPWTKEDAIKALASNNLRKTSHELQRGYDSIVTLRGNYKKYSQNLISYKKIGSKNTAKILDELLKEGVKLVQIHARDYSVPSFPLKDVEDVSESLDLKSSPVTDPSVELKIEFNRHEKKVKELIQQVIRQYLLEDTKRKMAELSQGQSASIRRILKNI